MDLDPGMAPVLQRRSSKSSRGAGKALPPAEEVRPDPFPDGAESRGEGAGEPQNGSLPAGDAVGNAHAGIDPGELPQELPQGLSGTRSVPDGAASQDGPRQMADSLFGETSRRSPQGGAEEAAHEEPRPPVPLGTPPQGDALEEPESGMRVRAEGAAEAAGVAEGATSQPVVSDEQASGPRTPAMEYADIWKAGFSPFAQQDG